MERVKQQEALAIEQTAAEMSEGAAVVETAAGRVNT